ncbi:MAG: 1-phosphofructokinase [Treponema sp.]|nr:1-phosphofructokinase [Treponema sp.]
MIYTLTVNPSLDYIVDLEAFKSGAVNRTCSEKIFAGGKGINVSIVLKNLGLESIALGFTAGFTGNQIEEELAQKGVKADFIRLADKNAFSRINVKLRSIVPAAAGGKEETEINGQGPELAEGDIAALFEKLDCLEQGDLLVLAGSIPKSLPQTFYSDIMARLSGRGLRFVVDATRDLLKKSLEYKPFLVKPNNFELGEIFGVELKSREEVIPYAEKMREMGAQNVLVSMAGQGAVLAAADGKIYQSPAPKCHIVNSVGAGDSMVAGFIAGFMEASGYERALRIGICAGTASASSEELASRAAVEKLLSDF